jgi:hypothetical protein
MIRGLLFFFLSFVCFRIFFVCAVPSELRSIAVLLLFIFAIMIVSFTSGLISFFVTLADIP